ncbi:MAG: hypothetical protein ACFFAS_07620 [Promethearchaeota archaeon]
MSDKKAQCPNCKHYAKTSSCGPCVEQGANTIKNIDLSLGTEISNPEEETNAYKYSCKIIMRYPEDFNELDPCNCEYYLPSFFGFR